jgi:hypothetical protein
MIHEWLTLCHSPALKAKVRICSGMMFHRINNADVGVSVERPAITRRVLCGFASNHPIGRVCRPSFDEKLGTSPAGAIYWRLRRMRWLRPFGTPAQPVGGGSAIRSAAAPKAQSSSTTR